VEVIDDEALVFWLFGGRSDHQVELGMTAHPTDDWRTKALANFSFEIVETNGENALAEWEELKTAGRGVPVVVGKDIDGILEPFFLSHYATLRPLQEALAAADAVRFPEGLSKMRRDETAAALETLRKLGATVDIEFDEHEPPLGEWPAATSNSPGLSIAYDVLTRQPLPKVYIVLVPTDDPTTVPAHLRWGGWNACPAPEYHVAALRHWRDRYGAELVGLQMDTLNLRVSRKPASRGEALELARVQHAYCNDIIDQGAGSLSALAAELMAHDWWFFWWD
jgi:hypothetical protein